MSVTVTVYVPVGQAAAIAAETVSAPSLWSLALIEAVDEPVPPSPVPSQLSAALFAESTTSAR